MPGFVVIMILYAVIGLMAAGTSPSPGNSSPQDRANLLCNVPHHDCNVLPGLRCLLRSGVGLAVETAVVMAFVVIGLLGVRLPFPLIVGYSLHRLWDLLHELQTNGAYSAFEPGKLTAIPLA